MYHLPNLTIPLVLAATGKREHIYMMIHCHCPQFSEANSQESLIVKLTSRVIELESDDVLSYNEDAGTLEQSVGPESSQPNEKKSSGDFSFFSYHRLHLQMRTN